MAQMIDEIAVGVGALAFALLLIWFFFAKREKPTPLAQAEGPVLSEVEGMVETVINHSWPRVLTTARALVNIARTLVLA